VVKEAWKKSILATDAIRRLHIKLSRTSKALKLWEKTCIGNIKSQLDVANEVMWQLDQAQERRALSAAEVTFKSKIKDVYLGLLAIQKMRARQRARLTNIKFGDASTKFFFLKANGRKRKKHIQILHTRDGIAINHDGFIRAFYFKCWKIVKGDVIAVILQISQLRGGTLNLLNMANIVLLPKKEQAERVGDFRPISLVHSVAKIFSKILASRLALRLPEMVSSNHSAFVKKRCIHDNFVLVQGIVKKLHKEKTPGVVPKARHCQSL
jgi:hypothetical protein